MYIKTSRFHLQNEALVARVMAKVLTEAVQKTCPSYLCNDLTLEETDFTCNKGGNSGEFYAQALGVGLDKELEAYLARLEAQGQTFSLDVNGGLNVTASLVVTDPEVSSTSGRRVARIVGSSGGVTSLIIVAIAVSVGAVLLVWRG